MAKSASLPRKPRQCRRCPDSHLYSQCPRTQAGKKYLSKKKANAGSLPSREAAVDGILALSTTVDPSHSVEEDNTADMGSFDTISAPPAMGGSTHSTDAVIDPVLLNPTSDPYLLQINGNACPSTPTRSTSRDEVPTFTPTSVDIFEELESPSTPNKNRPTVKNPIHGLVEGVKCGNNKVAVPRQKPLPTPIKDSSKSTRRFNRLMCEITARCERVSIETGCWLYLSAQHVNAHAGFVSYTSPRIRLEGKTQVTEIQNSFNALYAALLNARRRDAVSLSLQAQEYREQLQTAKQEIAEQNARIARLESELAARSNST